MIILNTVHLRYSESLTIVNLNLQPMSFTIARVNCTKKKLLQIVIGLLNNFEGPAIIYGTTVGKYNDIKALSYCITFCRFKCIKSVSG
jgi:hypothetical protein